MGIPLRQNVEKPGEYISKKSGDIFSYFLAKYLNPAVSGVLPQKKSRFPFEHGEAMEALFGQEANEYAVSRGGIEAEGRGIRLPNGVWHGFKGCPRNRRLSACLVFGQLFPWNVPNANVQLYHNPWATMPYRSVLCQLPQRVPDGRKMNRVGGIALADVFNLPTSWPGPIN